MRRLAAATLGMVSAIAVSIAALEQSQWDGLYTAEQARRGDALYAEHCAACHGADLMGAEAPPLNGMAFAANWNGLPLADLFEQIRATMPATSPGSLSRPQYADILAFVLSKGSAPSGAAELPSQTEALKQFKFVAQNPNAK